MRPGYPRPARGWASSRLRRARIEHTVSPRSTSLRDCHHCPRSTRASPRAAPGSRRPPPASSAGSCAPVHTVRDGSRSTRKICPLGGGGRTGQQPLEPRRRPPGVLAGHPRHRQRNTVAHKKRTGSASPAAARCPASSMDRSHTPPRARWRSGARVRRRASAIAMPVARHGPAEPAPATCPASAAARQRLHAGELAGRGARTAPAPAATGLCVELPRDTPPA